MCSSSPDAWNVPTIGPLNPISVLRHGRAPRARAGARDRARCCGSPRRCGAPSRASARSARRNRWSSTRRSARRETTPGSGGGPSHGPTTRTSTPSLRSSRASPSTWPCTPPGRDSEYGDVITTRISAPYGRRSHSYSDVASHARHRSLGQFGCIRCHCSGAARIRISSSCASAWVIRAMSSRNRPNRRTGTGGRTFRDGRDPVESRPRPEATSHRCAGRASRGRPAASCARRRTRPRRRRRSDVAVTSRQTMRLSRSACSTAPDARDRAGRLRCRLARAARRTSRAARAARSARRPRAADGPCTPSSRPPTPSRRGAAARGSRRLPTREPGSMCSYPSIVQCDGTSPARTSAGSRSISSQ